MIIQFILVLNLLGHQNASGIINVNSEVSNGIYSIEKIADLAQKREIKVVIFTDHFLERFEYGIPPFRKLIKKSIRMKCIRSYGIKRYLQDIEEASASFRNMVLIPGCKVRSLYYWTGSPLGNLTLHNIQKKFLLVGLSADALKRLPVIGNRRLEYDQYHGDVGCGPYQDVIDYTVDNGGLIFWVLPGAEAEEKIGRVTVSMPSYPESLLETYNYTGFGILYEGMKTIGIPGGTWDKVLMEYVDGKREKPVWAIGEIDYHYEGEAGGKRIEEVQTVFLLENLNRSSVMNALKNGKIYALRRAKDSFLSLDEFSISSALMGDEVTLSSAPVLRIKVSAFPSDSQRVVVKIIRCGKVIKMLDLVTPSEVQFKDKDFKREKMLYYRLEIRGEKSNLILTNPIFVRIEK